MSGYDRQGRAERKRPSGNSLVTVGDIEAMLKGKVDSLVHHLLPNAKLDGREMCVGSLGGEPGQSLRIHVGNGPRRGWWKDFSSGEGGDCLKLVAAVQFGGDIKRAVPWAKSWLGLDDSDPARIEQQRAEIRAGSEERARQAEREREQIRASARARWMQGVPIAGTPVEVYLQHRGIDLARLGKVPGVLRYHPALQAGGGADAPKLPAMVAQVIGLDGKQRAIHRTYLKPDGRGKADAADGLVPDAKGRVDAKRALGNYWGGHIPVWKGTHQCTLRDIPEGTDVYVSEGIEDGLTAACADPSLRVIAMLSLGNLMAIELPPQMGRLIILKQNDPPGSKAAQLLQRCVTHHRAAGRRVCFVEPPRGAKDLNEVAQMGVNNKNMGEVA